MNPTQKHRSNGTSAAQPPRLVLHADCTTCGRLNGDEDNALTVVEIALDHTGATGHVVVLNGTTDIPDEGWIPAREIPAVSQACRRFRRSWPILLPLPG